MSFGRELKRALDAAGMSAFAFARSLGYANSGHITHILKDRRPLPEDHFTIAIEVLGLNEKGRERQKESFIREALIAYLPDEVRPLLRKRFHQLDELDTTNRHLEKSHETLHERYLRLLESSRAR